MSPLPATYSAVLAKRGSPIPLKGKFSNRFYEPIILLDCLYMALRNNTISNSLDLALDVSPTPERAFRCFVNKLGQMCDSERGGDTVTAFLVLQLPDHVQYRFASNQRKAKDLIRVQEFVFSLLQLLGRAADGELGEKTSQILRISLSFTKPRVQAYVKALKTNVTFCIARCIKEGTKDSMLILDKLEGMNELLQFASDSKMDNNTFAKHCETLIMAIDRLYKSEVEGLIRSKTKEGRIDQSKDWCELRHAAGRLLSYLQAVKVLISTRTQWPELFDEDIEVISVASSSPTPCPLRNACKAGGLSMSQIIGRMTSDPEVMKTYRTFARDLEKFGVDERIRDQAASKSFKPLVHAEILLLDSLERDGGTRPSRFFNGYQYIGCSKPTCRLCDYYFSFHPSGVEVRPSHRNIYLNWRAPDVYPDQDHRAPKKREKLMNKILGCIRDDTWKTLSEKVPESKPHDSNTEPTYPIYNIQTQDSGDLDQLTTSFRRLEIEYPSDDEEMHSLSRKVSFEVSDTYEVDSDYDVEAGGVRF